MATWILFECGVVGLITFLWMNLALLKSFQKVRQLQNIQEFCGNMLALVR